VLGPHPLSISENILLGEKIKKLGFKHKHSNFNEELKKIVDWYRKNENWWRPLKK